MLVYFMAILYVLRPFGIIYGRLENLFYDNLVYFPPFWYIVSRKIWQPWAEANGRE
jgi:hypothetical protein